MLIWSNFNFKLKLSSNCSTIAIIFTVYLLTSLVQPYYAVSLAHYSYFRKIVECMSFNKPAPPPHNSLSSPINFFVTCSAGFTEIKVLRKANICAMSWHDIVETKRGLDRPPILSYKKLEGSEARLNNNWSNASCLVSFSQEPNFRCQRSVTD